MPHAHMPSTLPRLLLTDFIVPDGTLSAEDVGMPCITLPRKPVSGMGTDGYVFHRDAPGSENKYMVRGWCVVA